MAPLDPSALPSFRKTKTKPSFWSMALKSLALVGLLALIFVGIYWGFGRVAFETLSKQELLGQVLRGQVEVRRLAALEWATKLQNSEAQGRAAELREFLPTPDESTMLAQELLAQEAAARPDAQLVTGILSVLGHSSSLRAQEALLGFLEKPRGPEWAGAQVQAVLGLSRRSPDDTRALDIYKALLGRGTDPAVRKSMAYGLGFMGEGEMDTEVWTLKSGLLESLLGDPTADVRWNAALSAARLGMRLESADRLLAGLLAELRADLDAKLSSAREQDLVQKRDIYVQVLGALLRREGSDSEREAVRADIEKIADSHADLKIRQAAKDALKRRS